MDIAGHVSRQMLARYSHIRMEAKRRALEAVELTEVPTETQVQEEVARRQGHKSGHNGASLAKPRSVNN